MKNGYRKCHGLLLLLLLFSRNDLEYRDARFRRFQDVWDDAMNRGRNDIFQASLNTILDQRTVLRSLKTKLKKRKSRPIGTRIVLVSRRNAIYSFPNDEITWKKKDLANETTLPPCATLKRQFHVCKRDAKRRKVTKPKRQKKAKRERKVERML